MKLFVAVVFLAVALSVTAADVSIKKVSAFNYHSRFGIPKAAEIKKWEEENVGQDSTRIVGGWHADISQIPYQAGLVIQINWFFTSVCGASLVSHNRLVTAAHCKDDGSNFANSFTVVLGSNFIFMGGLRISTTDVVVHPTWNPDTLKDDIAVIRISSISFTNVIQPINLPSDNELQWDFAGWTATASGFGFTRDGGNIPSNQRLSAVTLPVMRNSICRVVYGPWLHSTNICGSGTGIRGTCHGDSGGPLAVTINNRPTLIGVTSYGSWSGCEAGDPSVFARVTSFVPWIWSL